MHSDDIPMTRIINRSYKDTYQCTGFSTKLKPSALSEIGSPHRLSLQVASSTHQVKSQEAILTARHLQLCGKSSIALIVTSSIKPFLYLISMLVDLGILAVM